MARKFFVGGNFKMNGFEDSTMDIVKNLQEAKLHSETEIVIAPISPFWIPTLNLLLGEEVRKRTKKDRKRNPNAIEVAAQNVFDRPNGAFTGELSAEQLMDIGLRWTLVGHSERRVVLSEDDSFLARKTQTALEAGLAVIFCCGETLEQRESNKTIEVVTSQLQAVAERTKDWSNIVIAYEPVWAIGTGKVATEQQAQEVHAEIRKWLASKISENAAKETRIIYGGSVSAKNCKQLAKEKDIDGFLVGGASMKPEFVDIVNARQ